MAPLRNFTALLLVASVSGAAFVPATSGRATTSVSFGFLKELGLEKPSWLPDFGGKKEEEAPVEPVAEEGEGSSEEAPAEES
mmetsp:Transcript_30203/g.42793  ORF Transcript_30203/g.42793 Transcript_30203/m.42793 type:complete len:82 (+) Transcript_30203:31-276(+)